jgi:hypothetical protein
MNPMRVALAFTVLASASLWSTPGRAQCTEDSDCKGDRVCNVGRCQAAAPVVAVAPASGSAKAAYRRRSTGLMIGGIVMASLGTASLATALGLSLAQIGCNDDDVEDRERCRAFDTAALATLLGGFGLTSAGVPMLVYGGKKLPLESAGATFSPWLSPNAAGLSLRVRM